MPKYKLKSAFWDGNKLWKIGEVYSTEGEPPPRAELVEVEKPKAKEK